MSHPSLKQEIHRVLVQYFEDLESVLQKDDFCGLYQALLAELGLRREDLGDLPSCLSFAHYLKALQILDAKEQIPGLGLQVGALKRCGTYGFTGVAFLTQSTFDQVHEFAIQAFEICYGQFLRLKICKEDAWIRARYELHPPELAHFAPLIEQTLMTGYRTISEVLPGWDWSACQAHFAYSPPDYEDLYARYIPFPCLFNQPHNQLCFPRSWGEASSNLAEKRIRDFCTVHFQAMLEEGRASEALALRIRWILNEAPQERLPKLSEIARQLRLPERSLRARLAQEGSSFRALLQETLLNRAKDLLAGRPDLSVKEIAFRLGFSQPSNFNRAFLKAVGMSPGQFRAQAGVGK